MVAALAYLHQRAGQLPRTEETPMDATLVLPKIDQARCTGCADCVAVCHGGVLAIRASKAILLNPADCDYCTDCEAVCPVRAIACPFEVVAGDARSWGSDQTRVADESPLPNLKEV
jgi:MinD superfamily P-loop ATPase